MLLLNSEEKSLDNFSMLPTQQFDNIKYKKMLQVQHLNL